MQAGCNFEPTAMARPCLRNHTSSASTIHWSTAVDPQEHSDATTDLPSSIRSHCSLADWIATSGMANPGTIETGCPPGIQRKLLVLVFLVNR